MWQEQSSWLDCESYRLAGIHSMPSSALLTVKHSRFLLQQQQSSADPLRYGKICCGPSLVVRDVYCKQALRFCWPSLKLTGQRQHLSATSRPHTFPPGQTFCHEKRVWAPHMNTTVQFLWNVHTAGIFMNYYSITNTIIMGWKLLVNHYYGKIQFKLAHTHRL